MQYTYEPPFSSNANENRTSLQLMFSSYKNNVVLYSVKLGIRLTCSPECNYEEIIIPTACLELNINYKELDPLVMHRTPHPTSPGDEKHCKYNIKYELYQNNDVLSFYL